MEIEGVSNMSNVLHISVRNLVSPFYVDVNKLDGNYFYARSKTSFVTERWLF